MSATDQHPALAPESPVEWKTLTARVDAEDMRLIDTACALVQRPRAQVAVEATLAAARKILEEKNISWPPEAA